MSGVVAQFSLRVEQVEDYDFRVHFDKEHYPELRMDEPPPLGKDTGPNPGRLLAASIGDCLAASLLFCARKQEIALKHVSAEVDVTLVRNERRRLRIGTISVRLRPELAAGASLDPCLDLFEDFCIVTQSVREGLDVKVSVEPV